MRGLLKKGTSGPSALIYGWFVLLLDLQHSTEETFPIHLKILRLSVHQLQSILYFSSAKLCYIDLLLIDIKTASRVLRVPLARFHTIFELSPIIRFRVTGIHPGVTDSQHW